MLGGQPHKIDAAQERLRPALGLVVARAAERMGRPRAPSRHTSFAGFVPKPANASGRTSPPSVRPLASLDRHFDQSHRHGSAGEGAGQKLFGLSLIFLGLDQVAQRPLHVVHRRPPLQARRLDDWNMLHRGNPHTQIGEVEI